MFNFDIQAAVNSIATIEREVAGVTTSYGWEQNPVDITDWALLPAIVHTVSGPQMATDTFVPGLHTLGVSYQLMHTITSTVLVAEAVPEGPSQLAGQHTNALLWQALADKLLTKEIMGRLATEAGIGVHTAYVAFSEPESYAIRPWPPAPLSNRLFWSIQYNVVYTITG